jgi:hypothetical protein
MHTTIQSSRVIFVNDSNEEQGHPGAEKNPNLVNQMRPMQWCLLVAVFAAISFFIISYRTLKRCGICFILGIQSLPRNHISSQAYNAWMGSAMKKT